MTENVTVNDAHKQGNYILTGNNRIARIIPLLKKTNHSSGFFRYSYVATNDIGITCYEYVKY